MTEPNNNPLHGVTLEQILTALVALVVVGLDRWRGRTTLLL